MSDQPYDPAVGDDEPYFTPPEAAKSPPVLPSGRYGETGEAEVVFVKRDVTRGDNPTRFLNVCVAVQHPELAAED